MEARDTTEYEEIGGNTAVCIVAAASPEPGTAEFAALCRTRDRRSFGYRFMKRAFDMAFSAMVCVVGVVPGIILSIFIAAESKGRPIYTQERVGRLGKPVRIFKFRTMVSDADDVEKYLSPDQLDEWHRERKVTDDPRITKLGRVLRNTSIDEIPQFANVFFGQLSMIGPRAISYEELGNFTPDQTLDLLSVSQGITGAWQCGPRNEATFENGLRQEIELSYARNASFEADLQVFFKTFSVMFGKNRTGR